MSNTSTVSRDRLISAAEAVVAAGQRKGVAIRAVGGVGIALKCPSARPPSVLSRSYSDLDFVARRREARKVSEVFEEVGLEPASRFNALNTTRMRFDHMDGFHADVFLDEFQMCHRLEVGNRLQLDAQTLSPSDLLLTKLQVAKLNHKDLTDIAALLLDHPVGVHGAGIDVGYVAGFLSQDWGWWRTATETLETVERLLPELELDPASAESISRCLQELNAGIEGERKSLRWRARARVGDRMPWREDPEDLDG